MDLSASISVFLAILLLSSFIKFATVLSVFRYGTGLVGVEFGVACLVAAFGLAVATLPPELRDGGFPAAALTGSRVDPGKVVSSLVPRVAASLDRGVVAALGARTEEGSGEISSGLAGLLPAFILSQLKEALTLGVLLLVPFVLLDILVAHLLSLLAMQQIGVQVVSMPLKILLFLAIDGWGMLGAKLLGVSA